ncbi:hypothetical protein H5410_004422 [Solanum commersonii]|uniref:Uncharacterized protein n=1 Tax=Solanum commersonii TaxID=4109 RepID=A0A9J6B7R0_SOLCO|nr:hypothetical protein H5410_004422 [Solanum commersonii]
MKANKDESETIAEDIILVVEKKKKKPLGKEKPKTKKAPVRKEIDSKKGGKKEPVKKRELFAESESKSEKGPGSKSKKMKVEKELTRDERVNNLKKQQVLNGRVFDHEIITKPGMCILADSVEIQAWTHLFINRIPVMHEAQVRDFYYNVEFTKDGSLNTQVGDRIFHLNEERLGEILSVPMEGIGSVVGQFCSKSSAQECGKLSKLNCVGIPKKLLNGEYQLLFEFVKKVLLPISEKRTVASVADLFLMEALSKFDEHEVLNKKTREMCEITPEHGENLGVYFTHVARLRVYLSSVSQVNECF